MGSVCYGAEEAWANWAFHILRLCLSGCSAPLVTVGAEWVSNNRGAGGHQRSHSGERDMNGFTEESLRHEHEALLSQIEALKEVADRVGIAPQAQLNDELDGILKFLTHRLAPHAAREEKLLYPLVARAMGSDDATRTMSRDHVEGSRLTAELKRIVESMKRGPATAALTLDLRRVLYSLYAIIKLHFAKEEELYLPYVRQGEVQVPGD